MRFPSPGRCVRPNTGWPSALTVSLAKVCRWETGERRDGLLLFAVCPFKRRTSLLPWVRTSSLSTWASFEHHDNTAVYQPWGNLEQVEVCRCGVDAHHIAGCTNVRH